MGNQQANKQGTEALVRSVLVVVVVVVIVIVALTMNRFEIADEVNTFAVNSR